MQTPVYPRGVFCKARGLYKQILFKSLLKIMFKMLKIQLIIPTAN